MVLGMGDSRYVNLFSWAEGEYRGRVAARFAMDNELGAPDLRAAAICS